MTTPTVTPPPDVPTEAWAEFLDLRDAGLNGLISTDGYRQLQALLHPHPVLRGAW